MKRGIDELSFIIRYWPAITSRYKAADPVWGTLGHLAGA